VSDRLQQWLRQHQAFGWLAVASIGAALLSLVAGLAVIVWLPADYFVRAPGPHGFWHSHPALRLTLLVGKNLFGTLVMLAGIIMAIPLVPGPGLLFILVGLGLMDFPGKRSLEARLLRMPHVLASVNRLRDRFHKPPIVIGP
jgi:hypothetical protein